MIHPTELPLRPTLEILSDPAAVAAIVETSDAVSRGEVFTTKDILTDALIGGDPAQVRTNVAQVGTRLIIEWTADL